MSSDRVCVVFFAVGCVVLPFKINIYKTRNQLKIRQCKLTQLDQQHLISV